LRGKGEAGYGGGPAGDLYVVTRVEPSKLYRRRGEADLGIDMPVAFAGAAPGENGEGATPEGSGPLKIPSGPGDGQVLRIKGRGAPKLKGAGKGNLIARVHVTVPKKLSKAEKEAIEKLQQVSGEDPREKAFS